MPYGCKNPLRVLVVDDEVAIAESLAHILCLRGHNAQCAYSAESAIEIVPTFEPQVLVADVFMGGMNGIELANLIIGRNPACRVILFSGQAEHSRAMADLHPSPHGYKIHPKPLHPEVLLAMLESEAEAAQGAQSAAQIPAKPPQPEAPEPLEIDRSNVSE